MNYTSSLSRKTYSAEGFVIGRRRFGEADRIIVLFTKDFGKLALVAKGVRRLKSRKRGGLEIFNLIKFSGAHGRSLDILTEVEVVDGFGEVRSNLKRVSVGYFFCEVVGKLTRDEERNGELYRILQEYFEKLKTVKNLKQLRFDFIKKVLVTLGFWPRDKKMDNPDAVLEGISERRVNSVRIGKKLLS